MNFWLVMPYFFAQTHLRNIEYVINTAPKDKAPVIEGFCDVIFLKRR